LSIVVRLIHARNLFGTNAKMQFFQKVLYYPRPIPRSGYLKMVQQPPLLFNLITTNHCFALANANFGVFEQQKGQLKLCSTQNGVFPDPRINLSYNPFR